MKGFFIKANLRGPPNHLIEIVFET